jgi:hypothetical protein
MAEIISLACWLNEQTLFFRFFLPMAGAKKGIKRRSFPQTLKIGV